MVIGLILIGCGVLLTAGPGWACLVIGGILFVAGGLDRAKR
jgi:hypothetical protein